MAIQNVATAREECRVCLTKWEAEMEGIKILIAEASSYSAEAFTHSVDDRMPRLQRATRAVIVRLSILVQVLAELEAEKALESTNRGGLSQTERFPAARGAQNATAQANVLSAEVRVILPTQVSDDWKSTKLWKQYVNIRGPASLLRYGSTLKIRINRPIPAQTWLNSRMTAFLSLLCW